MVDFAERLALIIDAKTGGAVTELQKVTKSADSVAVAQDKAAVSAAKMTAAQDRLAASVAKQQVAEAKASGDVAALATAQGNAAAAAEKSKLSKIQAAIASDKLAVSELAAKDAAANLGAGAAGATGLLERLGIAGTTVGGILSTLGPLIGIAFAGAAIKFLADGVRHFEQLTNQVRKFEQVTGASSTQASLLVGQMKQLGIDPDAAAQAFLRLGAGIDAGTTKLAGLGVEIARNKDGTVNMVATVENLRSAYQGSADASTRDNIAKQLGARQAAALLPLLNATKDQIKELNAATKASGGIVTDADQRNALQLKIAANEMKDSFANLEMGLSKNFVPALAQGLDLVSKTIESANYWRDKINAPGNWAADLHDKLFGGGNKASDAATKAAAEADVAAAAKEKDAEDKLTQSLTSELDAKRAVRDASQSLIDARQAEIDAVGNLNKLMMDSAQTYLKNLTDAMKDYEHASRAVQRAQESERDAQEALNKARERASALDLAEAQNKIALAGDRIGGAKAAEQQAQEKLDALLGSGNATAGQVAAAQAELATKHDEVTQSLLDQQQATVDLTKTKQKGTEADPAVKSAERSLADAHDSVRDAMDNQRDALDKLHAAEAGDPEYARKIADARRDLARAHNAVADAQDRQVTAALGLQTATDLMNTSLAGTATTLDNVTQKFKDLKAEGLSVDKILSLLGVNDTGTNWGLSSAFNPQGLGHRAKGGPLEPYQAYLVAEPGTDGEILQMGATGGYATPVNGLPGGSGLYVDVKVSPEYGNLQDEIGRAVAWSIRTTVPPRV